MGLRALFRKTARLLHALQSGRGVTESGLLATLQRRMDVLQADFAALVEEVQSGPCGVTPSMEDHLRRMETALHFASEEMSAARKSFIPRR